MLVRISEPLKLAGKIKKGYKMNQMTILKYRKEFIHYLNGGKLLDYHIDDTNPEWLEVNYGESITFFNRPIEMCLYIINDEYIEFRKALAEGKTIQFDHSRGIGACPEWKDIDFDLTDALVSLLRIKPSQPKFKKDDIIVNNRNGAIGIVEDRDVENGVPITWLTMIEEMPFPRCAQNSEDITPWEPKINSNELLWFWDDGDILEDYVISTLKEFINNTTKAQYKIETGNIYMNCEPFFNNLPINQKHRGKQ